MNAADLMTPHPAVIPSTASLDHAALAMRSRSVGMLPVVDDLKSRQLCGIITDRDIVVRCVAAEHTGTCLVRDHMTVSPLAVVQADDDLSVVLESMERNQVRRLPVVDDRGAVIGVIAQADLARKVAWHDRMKVEHLLETVSAPAR
jgi:CBS domain-containing protein